MVRVGMAMRVTEEARTCLLTSETFGLGMTEGLLDPHQVISILPCPLSCLSPEEDLFLYSTPIWFSGCRWDTSLMFNIMLLLLFRLLHCCSVCSAGWEEQMRRGPMPPHPYYGYPQDYEKADFEQRYAQIISLMH